MPFERRARPNIERTPDTQSGNAAAALVKTLREQIGESSRLIQRDVGRLGGAVGDFLGGLSMVDIARETAGSFGRVAKGMQGEAQPTIGDMFNVAGGLAGGGLAGRAARPQGSTLGIFGGTGRASSVPQGRRVKAHFMEKAGRSPQEINEATGFSRGVDGKWRFEISDHDAFVRQIKTLDRPPRLGEVLVHPSLYRHYPELAEIEVMPFRGKKTESAFYQPAWGDQPEMIGINAQLKTSEVKLGLLHETQHAVQFREAFASGGADTKEFVFDAVMSLVRQAETRGNMAQAKEARDSLRDFLSLDEKQQQKEIARFYKNLAGEVEARNVETRAELPPSARRRYHPKATEDVRRESQVVLDRNELAQGLAQAIIGR